MVKKKFSHGKSFLGGSVKLREVTISFIMFICLPAHLFTRKNSAPTQHFNEIVYLSIFWKCQKNLTRITGTLHEGLHTFMKISHWIRLRMRKVSDRKLQRNQNTYFMFKPFSYKSRHLWHNVEKYSTTRKGIDKNYMEHALCMLDK